MTLEVILWWVAWIVTSEIIFVIGYFKIEEIKWIALKFLSFMVGGFFIFTQLLVVTSTTPYESISLANANYIYLFYEFLILLSIGILFLINYSITKYVDKKNE